MRIDALSKQHGVPAVDLAKFPIAPEVLRLVPSAAALKHQFVPVNLEGTTLIIAMSDPSHTATIEAVRRMTGREIEVVVAPEDAIREAIARHYGAH